MARPRDLPKENEWPLSIFFFSKGKNNQPTEMPIGRIVVKNEEKSIERKQPRKREGTISLFLINGLKGKLEAVHLLLGGVVHLRLRHISFNSLSLLFGSSFLLGGVVLNERRARERVARGLRVEREESCPLPAK